MSVKERADLGFANALEDFDPRGMGLEVGAASGSQAGEDWNPQGRAAAGFRSREPRPEPDRVGEAPVRRRRTGRNTQFNLKARAETIEAFCAVADQQGWGLGETLEYAVALLQREYKRP